MLQEHSDGRLRRSLVLADYSNSNLEEAGHGADEAPASQAPANGDSGGDGGGGGGGED